MTRRWQSLLLIWRVGNYSLLTMVAEVQLRSWHFTVKMTVPGHIITGSFLLDSSNSSRPGVSLATVQRLWRKDRSDGHNSLHYGWVPLWGNWREVPHSAALHCTVLHCIALNCTALHCTALYCTTSHCTALHCIALHCTALHWFAHYTALYTAAL